MSLRLGSCLGFGFSRWNIHKMFCRFYTIIPAPRGDFHAGFGTLRFVGLQIMDVYGTCSVPSNVVNGYWNLKACIHC